MRVTCIVDNSAKWASKLWGEHGLAFFIENNDKRILFDTGQSGEVLLQNLGVLGLDPARIDAIVLSHSHSDHAGGIKELMKHVRPKIPLYAHREIFRERFSKKEGQIIPKSFQTSQETLEEKFSVCLHTEPQEVFPGVWTTGGIGDRPEPEGRSADHLMRDGEDIVPDTYLDDMAVVIEIGDRLMLLCGCCHAGLLNTIAHVETHFQKPITWIAGGLHLISSSSEQLQHVSDVLTSKPDLRGVYPCHCTGEAAFIKLTHDLGKSIVHSCPAGTVINFES